MTRKNLTIKKENLIKKNKKKVLLLDSLRWFIDKCAKKSFGDRRIGSR